ncbi:hypothetical protein FRC07_012852 [Ceratobasidium sp. 392]|nr:hypothetical protein FRC07_012852 [Ceratobasidium sp. 392]
MHSVKLANLLLSPYSRITKREIKFTLILVDAVVDRLYDPSAPLSNKLLKAARQCKDLIYVVAASPDITINLKNNAYLTESGGQADVELIFKRLLKRLVLWYCREQKEFTIQTYDQAVEYLSQHPRELRAAHKQYRVNKVFEERAKLAQLRNKAEAGGRDPGVYTSPATAFLKLINIDGSPMKADEVHVRLLMVDELDDEGWVDKIKRLMTK